MGDLTCSWRRNQLPIEPPLLSGAISNRGVVCVGGSDSAANQQEVAIYDEDLSTPPYIICAAGQWSCRDVAGTLWESPDDNRAMSPSAYAWSPNGSYLVTGSGNPERCLRVYDVSRRQFLECFGFHRGDLHNVAWSRCGRYVASASTYSKHELKLWRCSWLSGTLEATAIKGQIALPLFAEAASGRVADRLLHISAEAELNRTHDYLPWWEHAWAYDLPEFYGFGKLAFSPNSTRIAVALLFRTVKTRIVAYRIPSLDDAFTYTLPGKYYISDLAWSLDGLHILAATNQGEVFVIGPVTDTVPSCVRRLPFKAYRCQTNPVLPLCALASTSHERAGSVQEYSERDHSIHILDLRSMDIRASLYGSTKVIDLVWSPDGKDLFALTSGGERLRCTIEGASDAIVERIPAVRTRLD